MFTGIVQEMGRVASARAGSLVIDAKDILPGIGLGGSIAVNGACLTVTAFDNKSFTTDVMPETLGRTNLGLLRTGDKVNLERPMALGGELGGHLVQGHVDDTGRIASVARDDEAMLIRLEASPEVMRFIVSKGFIAVDADFSKYNQLLAEDMGIFFPQNARMNDEELARLRQIFREAFLAQLTDF